MEQERNKLFQEAVERLQNGQGLDKLLAAYPDLTEELQTVSRLPEARANAAEVRAMRSRLDAQFEARLDALEIPKQGARFPRLTLVASIAIAIFGLWLVFPQAQDPNTNELALTQSIIELSETVNPSPTSSPSATVSPTQALPSPSPEALCSPREDWFEYRVRSGDSLSQIAIDSGSTEAELMQANCLVSARTIIIGQIIYVPRLWEIRDIPAPTAGSMDRGDQDPIDDDDESSSDDRDDESEDDEDDEDDTEDD